MEEYLKQASVNLLKIQFGEFLSENDFKIISDKKYENRSHGYITTISIDHDAIELVEIRLYNSAHNDTFYTKESKLENDNILNYPSSNEIYHKLKDEVDDKFSIVTTFLKLQDYFNTQEGFISYNQLITDVVVFEKKHEEFTEKFFLDDSHLKWDVDTKPCGRMQIAGYNELKDLSGSEIVEFMRESMTNNCD